MAARSIAGKYDESFRFIQGRIAETIVEQLLQKLGVRVYRNGVENTFIMGDRTPRGTIAKDLASRPDFIAFDENDVAYYIEVKYRTDGGLSKDEIEKYPAETIIVLVSPNALRGCRKKDFPKFNLLADIPPFNRDRLLVKKYCEFCDKFFS
jgi:hypothetical protein